MTKNEKYAFIIFGLSFFFIGRDFMKKGLLEFYWYKVEKIGTTQGIVLESSLDDAISGMNFRCSYLYHVNNREFKNYESIPVYDTLTMHPTGDTLQVRYNVRQPWRATINTDYNLRIHFFAGLALLIWFLCAIVFLIIEVCKNFQYKKA